MTLRAFNRIGNPSDNNRPGIDRLRDPMRVLNHIDLIQKKLSIGQRWQLSVGTGGELLVHTDTLRALQRRDISVSDALETIHEASGISESTEVLKTDLIQCYQTGLLEFHPTDVCDLDCVDCHYRQKHMDTVPFSQVGLSLARLAPKAITITGGGEPNIYKSEGMRFSELVESICLVLPHISLGLINNNSHIPEGNWTEHISWQRSSVDAATPETYARIKRRPLFDKVTGNVKQLLLASVIPYVGIGFLLRKENAHELFDFLTQWYEWVNRQEASVQRRLNIQFRPISPGIEEVDQIRVTNKPFPDQETLETLSDQAARVMRRMKSYPAFAQFIAQNTNFFTHFGEAVTQYNSSLFLHTPNEFSRCFNALTHRVLRATGEEYPDFLLCNDPELSLGNPLRGNTDEEILRVALMEFFYFNRLGPFCNPQECRQGWVSNAVEGFMASSDRPPEVTGDSIQYFF